MLQPLTKRQKEILDFIINFIEKNGYSPSLNEIKLSFKLSSVATVHEHIEHLKKKGYIVKELNQARGITGTDNKVIEGRNFVAIPILFKLTNKLISQNFNKSIFIPKEDYKNTEIFAAIVDTNIYNSAGINSKDIVIFCTSNQINNGDVALISLSKDSQVLREVYKERARFKLAYPKQPESKRFYKTISIIGKLIMLIRDFS